VEKVLVRSWRALALRGVVSLAFGVIALVWPGAMLGGVVIFFGAYALLDGFLSLGTATRPGVATGIHWLVIEALLSIGVGVAALLWTSMTTIVLVLLVGFWAFATGVIEIILARRLWGKIPGDSLLAVAGAGSLLAGSLMILWPHTSALVLVVLLGGYSVFFGTTMIALALRLRRVTAVAPDFRGFRVRAG
jgi:uncharacterized membrane protein HdeD (DUF308 family)